MNSMIYKIPMVAMNDTLDVAFMDIMGIILGENSKDNEYRYDCEKLIDNRKSNKRLDEKYNSIYKIENSILTVCLPKNLSASLLMTYLKETLTPYDVIEMIDCNNINDLKNGEIVKEEKIRFYSFEEYLSVSE